MNLPIKKHIADLDRTISALEGIIQNGNLDYNRVGRLLDFNCISEAIDALKDVKSILESENK